MSASAIWARSAPLCDLGAHSPGSGALRAQKRVWERACRAAQVTQGAART